MSQPQDFFKYKGSQLFAEGVSISKIANAIGTPVYIYSSKGFLSSYRELKKGLSKIPHMICYAVKSNSNLGILQLLSNEGAGMDLVSGGELFRVAQTKTPGERIVFSGVGKTRAEIEQALNYEQEGIYSFHVESVEELKFIESVAKEDMKVAPVALRLNPNVDPKTHPYIATGLKKGKFGLNRNEVMEAIRVFKKSPWIRIRGLSMHIGSQIHSLSPFEASFRRGSEVVSAINSVISAPLEFIDVGGGMGITYEKEKEFPMQKYCQLVSKYFGPRSKTPLRVLVEPGRTLSGNSGVLVTEILYRKPRKEKDFLVVDAGMNDLLRPSLYQSFHEILSVEKKKGGGRKVKTDVVGPVCESACFLAQGRPLSKSLKQGDLLAVLSAGAYGFTMASNYNTRCRPAEVLVSGKDFKTIRVRENYDDLIRGESL